MFRREMDDLLRDSFSAGQLQRQLRLLPVEANYIQKTYPRFCVSPAEPVSRGRTWYLVFLP